MSQPKCFRWIVRHYRHLVILTTPIILSPFLFVFPNDKSAACAYMMILMGTYWVTEALPLCITALLPIVLAPTLKIMTAAEVCPRYFDQVNVLFVGGLLIACSIEHWGLHRRVALRVLISVGTEPRWLAAGVMLPTWFMSMWINNTTTTAMMVPIVEALIEQLNQNQEEDEPNGLDLELISNSENSLRKSACEKLASDSTPLLTTSKNLDLLLRNKTSDIAKVLSLANCYASNLGGMATLIGTGTNLVLAGFVTEYFGTSGSRVFNFGTWMLLAVPLTLIFLLIVWLLLLIMFLGWRSIYLKSISVKNANNVTAMLRREYAALGKISFPEKILAASLCILIVLWISKDPGVPGWSIIFTESIPEGIVKNYMSDCVPAIAIAIALFIIPSLQRFDEQNVENSKMHSKTVLTWPMVHLYFPWNITLLLGGSFALAEACQVSGLSNWIGQQLGNLQMSPLLLMFFMTFVTTWITELISNVAAVSILLPIVVGMARCVHIHPLMIAIPITIACSMAFCLPSATPSNAIVFGKGHLRVIDMARVGVILNVIGTLLVCSFTATVGSAIFDLNEYPNWAGECSNFTKKP